MDDVKDYYIFPVDTRLARGDSTHVREFLIPLGKVEPDSTVLTYNDVKSKSKILRFVEFRLRAFGIYLRGVSKSRVRNVYLRYFPGMFIDIFILKYLLRYNVFVELNAVISDEAGDRQQSWLTRVIQTWDESSMCRHAKALLCVTEEIKRYYGKMSSPKICYAVDNGVNTEHFDPKADFAKANKELAAFRDKFIIGFVGSLSPWQDFDTLLDAVAKLMANGGNEQYLCVIVGSGAQQALIEDKVKALGIEQNVLRLGAKPYDSIPSYINCFDVTVAPLKGSRTKNTGSSAIKVFEYLSMDKPIIITDVGSLSNLIESKHFGLKYKPECGVDLADKIAQLKNKDIQLVEEGPTGADRNSRRAYVQDNYSWQKVVNETLAIMRRHS